MRSLAPRAENRRRAGDLARFGGAGMRDAAPLVLRRPAAFFAREYAMLYYAAVFLLIALVAAVLGFGGIAAGAAEIAKILFFVFLVLFVGSLIWGLLNKRNL